MRISDWSSDVCSSDLHHAGLPDGIGGAGSLEERLKNPIEPLDPVWREEIVPDATGLMPDLSWHPDLARRAFQLGVLGRMIFPCLVDADFRDTEAFSAKTEGRKVDRHWPPLPAIVDRRSDRFDPPMAEKRRTAHHTALTPLRPELLAPVRVP